MVPRSSFNIHDWPQGDGQGHGGLAYSWQGGAWVQLQLSLAGLKCASARQLGVLFERLTLKTSKPVSGLISFLVGAGAGPLVASLACQLDPAFLPVFNRLVRRWIAAAKNCCSSDLMTGAAGALVACGEIENHLPGMLPSGFLKELHGNCLKGLNGLMVKNCRKPGRYGFSHGLSGYLLALEVGHSFFGLRFHPATRDACLGTLKEGHLKSAGRGSAWPHSTENGQVIIKQTWCNGAPGIALAMLAGHSLTGSRAYKALARMALKGTVSATPTNGTFCCGSTGIAHTLLEAYRLTGNPDWLAEARRFAAQFRGFPASKRFCRSFHYGRIGQYYLDWRVRHPGVLPLMGQLFSH